MHAEEHLALVESLEHGHHETDGRAEVLRARCCTDPRCIANEVLLWLAQHELLVGDGLSADATGRGLKTLMYSNFGGGTSFPTKHSVLD